MQIWCPMFIELPGRLWSLPENMTVAQWRQVRGALEGDEHGVVDEHTLAQVRAAKLILGLAERDGAPEDAIPLKR